MADREAAMPDIDDLLIQLRATPHQFIQPTSIRTTEALQPRDIQLAPFKAHARLESQSSEHVSMLAGLLAVNPAFELEPVLIAKVGRQLFLVDGHHRLRAYRTAGRPLLPARIMDMDMTTAAHLSKLVNLDGVKLPMDRAQKLEAAWQHLAYVTHRGKTWLPAGNTCRSMGARFGVSPDTVSRMCKGMKEVRIDDFSPQACDKGTGWPLWKHVKGNAIRDRFGDMDAATKQLKDALAYLKAKAKLEARFDPDTILLALEMEQKDNAAHDAAGTFDALPDWSAQHDAGTDSCPKLSS
jgi:hypothetical protein